MKKIIISNNCVALETLLTGVLNEKYDLISGSIFHGRFSMSLKRTVFQFFQKLENLLGKFYWYLAHQTNLKPKRYQIDHFISHR